MKKKKWNGFSVERFGEIIVVCLEDYPGRKAYCNLSAFLREQFLSSASEKIRKIVIDMTNLTYFPDLLFTELDSAMKAAETEKGVLGVGVCICVRREKMSEFQHSFDVNSLNGFFGTRKEALAA